MLTRVFSFLLVALIASSACAASPMENSIPNLTPVSFEEIATNVLFDQEIWDRRADILKGIGDNLRYLRSDKASRAYEQFDRNGVPRELVEKSLVRFEEILTASETSEELRQHLMEEFQLYQPMGTDGRGTIRFTGYFQPTYKASRVRTSEYKYPIYAAPSDFIQWQKPHPTRVFLEGYDGTGNKRSPLYGKEIAWLNDRYKAFMIHVQGSAILELTDGSKVAVGFAGATDHPFKGITKAFMARHGISWTNLPQYFAKHPNQLNECLAQNNRYIFFKQNPHPLPIGSLGVPVIAERSIATDKRMLPPGALGLIHTAIPFATPNGGVRLQRASRFVLDQDTGSAIKGPGRVDLFMGTGSEAQRRANHIYADGKLYYLLLRSASHYETADSWLAQSE